jgi:hypothetical protein
VVDIHVFENVGNRGMDAAIDAVQRLGRLTIFDFDCRLEAADVDGFWPTRHFPQDA